jgi:predicted flap endonuclease-1-like 5' DNA nuclease
MDVDVRDRTDPSLISTSENDVALPEEIARLHNWPGDMPDAGPPDGEPVTVAVMDSGIHPDAVEGHPWFEGASVIGRYDAAGSGTREDEIGHGTGVASLIARMAPAVRFIDVKIFGSRARTGFSVIRRAYEWLIENAGQIDLVNMSWGARRNIMQINQLHERLVEAGVRDVVAAGNTGADGGSPATSGLAFSAGAITEEGVPARFSSFDPDQGNPDIATVGIDVKMARAPGTGMGTALGDDFVKASGTSFSAPLTTAAYATALAKKRADWAERLAEGAEDIEGTPRDGAGILKLPSDLSQDQPEEGPSEGDPPEEDRSSKEVGRDGPPPPTEEEAELYVYRAEAKEVIDGDTIDLSVDLGFGARSALRIRLEGVDTAEIFFVEEGTGEREAGIEHKQFAEGYLYGENGEPLPLTLKATGAAEDYGQWIGHVRAEGREETLSEVLIEEFPSVEIGAEEPPGESPEAGTEESTEEVDLEVVSGIGGARAEMLREAGYQSAGDVATASAEQIASDTDLSEKRAQNLIESADKA